MLSTIFIRSSAKSTLSCLLLLGALYLPIYYAQLISLGKDVSTYLLLKAQSAQWLLCW